MAAEGVEFITTRRRSSSARSYGGGQTYVFELLVESAWKGGRFIPCLLVLWLMINFGNGRRGWGVGLVTGDLRYKTDASIVVATLETQRAQYLPEICPIYWSLTNTSYLLMRDGDPGMKSLWLCCPGTLLLMSGSVANPQEVADWLSTHGRSVSVIFEIRRPVPLEEVFVEAILKNPFHGRKVRGKWPKLIEGALHLGLGPILVFFYRDEGSGRNCPSTCLKLILS